MNAGDSTVYPMSTAESGNVALAGDIDNDGMKRDSCIWTLISQQAGVVISGRKAVYASAMMIDTGAYIFELRAYYGQVSYADSVEIKIRPNLPFIILSPQSDEQVLIGRTYVVRWQMDPSKSCTVELSVDNGINYTWLNPDGAVYDSLEWTVDAGFAHGTQAIIKVHKYQEFDPVAMQVFFLVDSISAGNAITHDRNINRDASARENTSACLYVASQSLAGAFPRYAFDAAGRMIRTPFKAGPGDAGRVSGKTSSGIYFSQPPIGRPR